MNHESPKSSYPETLHFDSDVSGSWFETSIVLGMEKMELSFQWWKCAEWFQISSHPAIDFHHRTAEFSTEFVCLGGVLGVLEHLRGRKSTCGIFFYPRQKLKSSPIPLDIDHRSHPVPFKHTFFA